MKSASGGTSDAAFPVVIQPSQPRVVVPSSRSQSSDSLAKRSLSPMFQVETCAARFNERHSSPSPEESSPRNRGQREKHDSKDKSRMTRKRSYVPMTSNSGVCVLTEAVFDEARRDIECLLRVDFVPRWKSGTSLDEILRDSVQKEAFEKFLEQQMARENLLFVEAATAFREHIYKTQDELTEAAVAIFDKYLKEGAEMQVNTSAEIIARARRAIYGPERSHFSPSPSSSSSLSSSFSSSDSTSPLLRRLSLSEVTLPPHFDGSSDPSSPKSVSLRSSYYVSELVLPSRLDVPTSQSINVASGSSQHRQHRQHRQHKMHHRHSQSSLTVEGCSDGKTVHLPSPESPDGKKGKDSEKKRERAPDPPLQEESTAADRHLHSRNCSAPMELSVETVQSTGNKEELVILVSPKEGRPLPNFRVFDEEGECKFSRNCKYKSSTTPATPTGYK